MNFTRVSQARVTPEEFMERYKVSYAKASEMAEAHDSSAVYLCGSYQVTMDGPHKPVQEGWPAFVHLSIVPTGKPDIPWEDLQDIKNSLCGRELEALEVYPAESRLVNMGPNRHLWVFVHPGFKIPLGYNYRMVKGELNERATTTGRFSGTESNPGNSPKSAQPLPQESQGS